MTNLRQTASLWLAITATSVLLAQEPAPTRLRAGGERRAVTANAGLQPDHMGHGLLGGGADYRVRFADSGMRFEPALGPNSPTTQHLGLRPTAVNHGLTRVEIAPHVAPQQVGCTATYNHGNAMRECYEVRPEGVELTWRFDRPLGSDGDLVVHYAVDTSFAAPMASSTGLDFRGEHGGVHVGAVTGIDATGRACPGSLAWIDGGVAMSLPAAFVNSATWPIVLDPLLGTTFPVSVGLTYADGEPDIVRSGGGASYLIVWERTFSATNVEIRGQRVDAFGSLFSSTIFFGSNGVASSPRTAAIGNPSRYGVVWCQQSGSTHSIQYQSVEASTGTLGTLTTIVSSTTDPFVTADIGAETDVVPGSGRGFLILYEDDVLNAIRRRQVTYSAADALQLGPAASLLTDQSFGATYHQPALSRAAGPDGVFLMVVRQRTFLGGSSILALRLNAIGNAASPIVTVDTSTSDNLFLPECDGVNDDWVVACERHGSGLVQDAVRLVSVRWTGSAHVIGTPTGFGGSSFIAASAPTVCYGEGRTWIGYRQVTSLPTASTTLRVAAVDSATCANCNDSFSVPLPGGSRIAVARAVPDGAFSSGPSSYPTWAVAVYHDSLDDIAGQKLEDFGSGGTGQNLGGHCGPGSLELVNYAPTIGTRMEWSTLPFATPLLAVFNLSPPTPGLACGACVWTPFSATLTPPLVGGAATVQFVVPCYASLIGAQFETQWTFVDPAQAPCPQLPGFWLSRRTLWTIGQ